MATAIRVETIPGIARKFGVPEIITQSSNLMSGFVATLKLSPTAVLPANWVIGGTSGISALVWDMDFSTDTAIEVKWGRAAAAAATGQSTQNLIGPAGSGAQSGFGAQVVGGLAITTLLGGAFCAANMLTPLLGKTWFSTHSGDVLLFQTAAVAANCYLQIYFTEFTEP